MHLEWNTWRHLGSDDFTVGMTLSSRQIEHWSFIDLKYDVETGVKRVRSFSISFIRITSGFFFSQRLGQIHVGEGGAMIGE